MKFLALTLATILTLTPTLHAQNQVVSGGVVGGVSLSTEGMLQVRQTTPIPLKPKGDASILYVSLPRALDAWRAALDAGKPVPGDVRTLHGLTRIDHLFLFPDARDLVLAGAAEPLADPDALQPTGTVTGRPALQLEDLITALRAVADPASRDTFGCSLDAPPENAGIRESTVKKFGNGPRDKLLAELKKALAPQRVRLFGVPEESRLALVMLAADYRLKRLCMGLDPLPPGLPNALGTEQAAARFWFEPAYDPLRVSADGLAYELRGPRLKLLAGAAEFVPGNTTPAQTRFAENLSANIDKVAARSPAIADLQNIADCLMVAALIRKDGLAEKAGIDLAWLNDAAKYKTRALPVPRTAETLVQISSNLLVQGGVSLKSKTLAATPREPAPATPVLAAARPTDTWFLETRKAK